ncbi:FtsX-like permease family protein [Actinoplanes sp. G11-F43]|uniref:FtsX-like permease family protein n=1 Tax=Actinoplanes sp. G11-F43 TaxID=3424130 RepID=UPI003D34A8C0
MLLRRARAQWPLLAALLLVVVIGATLLGVCALLVTSSADRAREVAASRATGTEVTAYTVAIGAADAASVAADTADVLIEALRPFPAEPRGRAASIVRGLPDVKGAVAYLGGVQDLPGRATLVTGRWPAAAGETVVLDTTARLLDLSPGSRVRLGAEHGRDPAPGMGLTVVGVVRALPGAGWDRDPLGGAGYDPAFRDGSSLQPARAFGPFLIGYRELLSNGSALARLEVTATPDLSDPDHRDLVRVTASVRAADARLSAVVGDRVQIQRISSRLPSLLLTDAERQRVTTSAVLSVAVLGAVLTGTALALAGRLTAGVRASETALLTAMGTSRPQLALRAGTEAGLLALAGAVLAVPLSSLVHSALTRTAPLSGAGLGTDPLVTGVQVGVVFGGALLFAGLSTRTGAQEWPSVARAGGDVALAVLAIGGWWQLRSTESTGVDAVRVLAPGLLLVAGCALVLRLVPPALGAADRLARGARGLAFPLAVFEAARRPRATAAGLLVTLGCAAATFAVAFGGTWQKSQIDQADLAVGTDLAITLSTPALAGQGQRIAEAVGGTVGPAGDRGVAIGQWLGAGDPPHLVATTSPGRVPVEGIPLAEGAALRITVSRAPGVSVTPRLILEEATGLRTTCVASAVPLDGRTHTISGCVPAPGQQLVTVMLPVTADFFSFDAPTTIDMDVTIAIPGRGEWIATSAEPYPEQVLSPAVTVTGKALRMTAQVQIGGNPDAALNLVATAFGDPGRIPVAVAERFAGELSLKPGDQLDMMVNTTAVPITVAEVVPAVPSAPGAPALRADIDTLSRALLLRGDPRYPIDAWWVTDPRDPDAAAGLHLGETVTRTGEAERLSNGPTAAALPAMLRLLTPAALLLVLAGLIVHVTCDLQARAVEVARLRGLGMSRRDIRTTLLGQHGLVLVPLLTAGTLVGALATWTIGPLLVRSESGSAPNPAAAPVWPWAAEAGLLAVLFTTSLLAVTVVVTVLARRADAAHLRVTS